MLRTITTALTLGLILLLAACTPAPPPAPPDTREADAKTLREIEAAWSKAAGAKDLEGSISAYADNARFMMAGIPAATGKEAIRKSRQEAMADPAYHVEFQTTNVTVARNGDIAVTEGTYTANYTEPKTKKVMLEKGYYLTGWAKQADGTWKVFSDMSTPEAPPAPVGKK